MSRRLMGMRHHLDDDIIDGESETRLHVGIMYILSLPLTELFLFAVDCSAEHHVNKHRTP
jgi:hypothetical protein